MQPFFSSFLRNEETFSSFSLAQRKEAKENIPPYQTIPQGMT